MAAGGAGKAQTAQGPFDNCGNNAKPAPRYTGNRGAGCRINSTKPWTHVAGPSPVQSGLMIVRLATSSGRAILGMKFPGLQAKLWVMKNTEEYSSHMAGKTWRISPASCTSVGFHLVFPIVTQ
ncbi:Hypothetical predicted protein, partial [Marmota monax]